MRKLRLLPLVLALQTALVSYSTPAIAEPKQTQTAATSNASNPQTQQQATRHKAELKQQEKAFSKAAAQYYSQGKIDKALAKLKRLAMIRQELYGVAHIETAKVYHNLGIIFYLKRQYAEAAMSYRLAFLIRKELLGQQHPDTQASWNNVHISIQHLGMKTFDEYHQKIIDIESQLEKIDKQIKESQYKAGLNPLQILLKEYEQWMGKGFLKTANAYILLSNFHDQKGQYQTALTWLAKISELVSMWYGSESVKYADSESKLGYFNMELGLYKKALKSFNKALKVRKKSLPSNHVDIATSYHNIGLVHQDQGQYEKALKFLNKALEIRKKSLSSSHIDIAIVYNNIGLVYQDQGQYEKALSFHKKSLKIIQKPLPSNYIYIANIYSGTGLVYYNQGQYEKALSFYNKDLEISKKYLPSNHVAIGGNYNSIGLVYQSQGQYEKALEFLNKALKISKKSLPSNHVDIAASYNNMGLVYHRKGQTEKALELYNKALEIQKKSLPSNHPYSIEIKSKISSAYRELKNLPSAYLFSKQAFEHYLDNRQQVFTLSSSKNKQHYLKHNFDMILYHFGISLDYIESLKEAGRKAEVVKIEENVINNWLNYKGSIIDSEAQLQSFVGSTKDPNIKKQFQQLIALKKQLSRLQSPPKITEKETKASIQAKLQVWRTKHQQQQTDIDVLTQKLMQQVPAFKTEADLQRIKHQDIAEALGEHEVYLDMADLDETVMLFAVSREGFSLRALPKKGIKPLLNQFKVNYQQLQNEEVASTKEQVEQSKVILAKLYKKMIANGIDGAIKDKTSLIISPDGFLHDLPFEALYDEAKAKGEYLIEQKDIRYIGSGRELLRSMRNQQGQVKAEQPPTIFANPDYGMNVPPATHRSIGATKATDQLVTKGRTYIELVLGINKVSSLPETQREADSISELYQSPKAKLYTEQDATEANLLSQVKRPKILHIASHGYFFEKKDIDNPLLQSGLILAGANNSIKEHRQDGFINGLKLSGLDLKGTELVVLSACDTGKVDSSSTEGISGLGKAFFQAGAHRVLMSLWKVDDAQTANLMTRFYHAQAKQSKKDYSQALKDSKLAMIKEGKHPYYWAGFLLNGY